MHCTSPHKHLYPQSLYASGATSTDVTTRLEPGVESTKLVATRPQRNLLRVAGNTVAGFALLEIHKALLPATTDARTYYVINLASQ